jgi:hypothetical protein
MDSVARNKRITLHFTPTSASWLNLVETFFSIITRQAIGAGDRSDRLHRAARDRRPARHGVPVAYVPRLVSGRGGGDLRADVVNGHELFFA